MNTIRLFEEDPYMRTFEANVTLLKDFDGLQGVILDRTCFYPTSGGQPHDRGELEGIPVVDVVEEGETIVHVLDGSIQEVKTVRGEIDWERRFGHMQQHTGQHVLSQAFVQAAEAETIGFHLGEERSTLDLNRADISAEVIAQTEQIAGLNTSPTKSEASRPSVRVMGRYFMKSPMTPGQNISGRNAQTVVNVEVVTGQATCRAPSMAASTRLCPS